MKNLILPFILLLTFVFSCRSENDEMLEKKVASYDVYVSGKDNGQLCYWKNGIQHILNYNLPANENPSKIFIDNNDIYVKGRYGYWKNGNYTTYHQAAGLPSPSIIDIFDFYVKNGNIYFVGYLFVNVSSATIYEFCYWQNGMKNLLFTDNSTYNDQCTITEFNSDVYIGANKKINGVKTGGYFKNTTFYPLHNAVSSPQNTFVVSNENNVYFSSLYFYKNLVSGIETTFTPTSTTGNYQPTLDLNDVYINGGFNAYYKNANIINDIHPSEVYIPELKVVDGNIYMIRTDPNATQFKLFINGVVSQIIVNSNFDSHYNNITVVKN